jgi:hypothetical protein
MEDQATGGIGGPLVGIGGVPDVIEDSGRLRSLLERRTDQTGYQFCWHAK